MVLDIRLPEMDGWEVLAELKADPATSDIPVIVASIVDERPRGLALGAADYLLKPCAATSSSSRCAGRRPGRPASPVGARMNSGRILVVEDNPLNLKLVRDVLEHAGYEVVDAESGEEGLEARGPEPPDLVLMDLQLPGIDGAEALQRLRAGILDAEVPVVAVTALAMAEDRAAALTPASTAGSRSRSACAPSPARSRDLLARGAT